LQAEHTPAAPEAGADDWDEHWRRFEGAAELNPAQAFRRRLILAALAIERPGARILDIGSGTGDLAADLVAALPAPHVLGLELSETGVEIARRKVPGAEFEQRDLLAGALPGAQHSAWAEYAVCSEVLEHVDDPAALLRGARPYLEPGARVLVTVPGGPMSAFDRHIGHRRHFDRDSLARVIADAGLEVESVRGAGFPSFNVYRWLIVALGDRVVDASPESDRPPGLAARAAARCFDTAFRINRGGRRLGFQMIAVAHQPVDGS
jgi:2-polyprenyl-3-methyl-5-hydroxy-6-metoxy-1,4-benzoquinol methylase